MCLSPHRTVLSISIKRILATGEDWWASPYYQTRGRALERISWIRQRITTPELLYLNVLAYAVSDYRSLRKCDVGSVCSVGQVKGTCGRW